MTTAVRCLVLLPLAGLLAGCANSPTSVTERDPFKGSDPFQAAAQAPAPSEKLDVWHQPEAQIGHTTALAAPDPYQEQARQQQAAGWSSTTHVTHPEYRSVSSSPVQTAAVTDAAGWETPAEDVEKAATDSPIQQAEYATARPLTTETFEEPAAPESDKPVFADSPDSPASPDSPPSKIPDWWLK